MPSGATPASAATSSAQAPAASMSSGARKRMRLRAAHGDLEQPLPCDALDGMNLHAALQAAAALLQPANETLMQGVDVDVRRAGLEQSQLRELRLEHRHQRAHLRARRAAAPAVQARIASKSALDLRGLLPRADHERAARREQRVLDEAARRPLEERTAGARQRADLRAIHRFR